jgi:hypothetical protein
VIGQATPPADITNLTATKEGLGDVLLRWTESTSPNVREYLIQDTVTDQSWNVRGSSLLIRNTALGAHTYTVTTIDTSGNESTTPPSVSLTTTSADLIAPFIAGSGIALALSSGQVIIAGSGGGAAASIFVESETPSGSINGSNVSFTLKNAPAPGTLQLYRNGVRQGAGGDYTITGNSITFGAAPSSGDVLLADYSYLPVSLPDDDVYVTNETPAGTVNGSNVTFTLANAPAAGTLQLYHNGVRQQAGAGADYTLSGSTITFAVSPLSGDVLLADYSCSAPSEPANYVTGETPSGTVNGSNVTFMLAHAPATGTLQLYRNGVRQQAGSGADYTLSGSTITFNAAPPSGDILIADYRY